MLNIIKLPPPQKDLPFPLMKALMNRRSCRKWQNTPLSMQDLSNLLWAACGITQDKKNTKTKRTAPSACNSQEISIYLALDTGFYHYIEQDHSLIQISTKDIREYIGTQKMMRSAPVGLIFISDYSRMKSPLHKSNDSKRFCSAVDTGYISQNIYLYCAAAHLNTVALGLVNREKLHEIMALEPHEKIVLTQIVGYPPKD